MARSSYIGIGDGQKMAKENTVTAVKRPRSQQDTKSGSKAIGLQNRLDILIQAVLDYQVEGGIASIVPVGDGHAVFLPAVDYHDGKLLLANATGTTSNPEVQP